MATTSSRTTQSSLLDGATAATAAAPPAEVVLTPLLASRVQEAAEQWASRVLTRAHTERRHVCGGWPGTVSEARAVLAVSLLPALPGESRQELERVGRDRVARGADQPVAGG